MHVILPAAMLLLAMLLFVGACTDGPEKKQAPPKEKTEVPEETTSSPNTSLETTGNSRPSEVTLGKEPRGEPEAVLRLEGDSETTFSGLCTLGGQENNVLSVNGKVPERFTFDLNGSELSCRIEKRDQSQGALKVVLIVGDATRSVQQTNSPGGVIKVSYEGS
jgi:hypothetical protein